MGPHLSETERVSTRDPLALLLGGGDGGRPLEVFPGYCEATAPITVQITGDVVLTGLRYLGAPGSLAVGPVMLLRMPDSAPLILGNINST
jgi:hypothetical protein